MLDFGFKNGFCAAQGRFNVMPDDVEIPWAKEISDRSAHDFRGRPAPGLFIFMIDITVALILVDVRKECRHTVHERQERTLASCHFRRLLDELFDPASKVGHPEIDPM